MTVDRISPSIERRIGYFVDANANHGAEFAIDGYRLRHCLGTDKPSRRLPGWIRNPVSDAALEYGVTERAIIAQLEKFAAAQLSECSFASKLDTFDQDAVCNIAALALLSPINDAAKISILQQFVGGYVVKAAAK